MSYNCVYILCIYIMFMAVCKTAAHIHPAKVICKLLHSCIVYFSHLLKCVYVCVYFYQDGDIDLKALAASVAPEEDVKEVQSFQSRGVRNLHCFSSSGQLACLAINSISAHTHLYTVGMVRGRVTSSAATREQQSLRLAQEICKILFEPLDMGNPGVFP